MILEIVKYGTPVLREKGRAVKPTDEKVAELAENMIDTMRHAQGVGLAAQQIGVPVQLCVVDVAGIEDRPSAMWIDDKEVPVDDYMPLILLNPKLKLSEEKESGNEGCLSFPDITAEIVRAEGVRCTATRLDGSVIEFEAAGLLARALQHEVDHLNGVLFIDRMNSAAKAGLAGRLKRLQKETKAVS
jgi:peptide deformylase